MYSQTDLGKQKYVLLKESHFLSIAPIQSVSISYMSITCCMQVRTMAMDKKGLGRFRQSSKLPNSIYRQNNDISALPLIAQPLKTCQQGLAHAVTRTSKSAARKMMSQEITTLSTNFMFVFQIFKRNAKVTLCLAIFHSSSQTSFEPRPLLSSRLSFKPSSKIQFRIPRIKKNYNLSLFSKGAYLYIYILKDINVYVYICKYVNINI